MAKRDVEFSYYSDGQSGGVGLRVIDDRWAISETPQLVPCTHVYPTGWPALRRFGCS